jgi:hypothetical protein
MFDAAMDLSDLEPGQAIAVDWTEADYFGDRTALTRSSLWLLAADPTAFCEWLSGGAQNDDEPSKAMRRGTNSHLAIFEPNEWLRRVGLPEIPRPPGARKGGTIDARNLWGVWQTFIAQRERVMSTIPDRIDVTPAEYDEVRAIAINAWSHTDAAVLLGAPGKVEQTVLWREPTTGVLVKVRLDKFSTLTRSQVYGTELAAGPAISDLKTAKDHRPRPFFTSSVARLGYLEQAAIYSDATEALVGERPNFYFIVVRSGKPRTAVYTPSDEQLQRGRDSYMASLCNYLDRVQSGDWRAPHECGVQPLWDYQQNW